MPWLAVLTMLACSGPPAPPAAEAQRADAPASPAQPPHAPRPPNVLVVVWDTVRADHTSLYGHPIRTTPHLEALAERGVLYERAVSPGVWTLPSHAALFTGLPVSSHGVSDTHKHLDRQHTTLAEVLTHAGYDAWAWSANPYVSEHTRMLQGFRDVSHPWDKRWLSRTREHMGAVAVPEVSTRNPVPDNRWQLHNTAPVAVQAFDAWLSSRRNDRRPWLGFINMMEAHTTRRPTAEARAAVMTPAQRARAAALKRDMGEMHDWIAGTRAFSPEDLDAIRATYDAALWDLDRATHELVEVLRAQEELDDTMLVITADHGELLGEHGLFGHQLGVWHELTRVPLLVVYPDGRGPRRVSEPTSTAEVFRLVLHEVGVMPAPDQRAGLDWGRREHGAVTEYTEPMASTLRMLEKRNPDAVRDAWRQPWMALERGDHVLHLGKATGATLYDITVDPHQQSPLDDPDLTRALRAQLGAWRKTRPSYDSRKADRDVTDLEADDAMREGLQELGYVE